MVDTCEHHQDIETLVQEGLSAVGMALWGLEWRREGTRSVLCIYVDKPEGVSLEDCTQASRQVSRVLDAANCIQERYYLELSSPGIEPRLFHPQHCERFLGSRVRWQTGKGRTHRGVLQGVSESNISIEVAGDTQVFPFHELKRLRVLQPEEK